VDIIHDFNGKVFCTISSHDHSISNGNLIHIVINSGSIRFSSEFSSNWKLMAHTNGNLNFMFSHDKFLMVNQFWIFEISSSLSALNKK
jgi:hypothetical protein